MSRRLWAAIAWVAFSSSALADWGRDCNSRPLTAAEHEASGRLAQRLRNAMSAAPAGWTVRDERTDVGAGSCAAAGGKWIPQPVTISVLRNYVRKDAPPPAAAAAAPQPQVQPSLNAEQHARAAELEKQIADLQRKDREAGAAYREARSAGDSAAQRRAAEESREYRIDMRPLQRELGELRTLERRARAADSQARTDVARLHMQEQRANRRDASISIVTNLRQSEMRGASPVSVSGAPLAFHDRSGVTQLFFGGWRLIDDFASAQLDEGAPTTRVQNIRVRIDGNEPVTQQLIHALDLKAVQDAVEGPSPRQARVARGLPEESSAPVTVSLQVGTSQYRFSGPAECKAASQASIYGINASLYSVSQRSGGQSLKLTLWQPKDGTPSMMSLHISTGGARYEVDTVKAGAKRETRGSGNTVLQKAGSGGVFAVHAIAAGGEKISGTIRCSSFGAIQAEGG